MKKLVTSTLLMIYVFCTVQTVYARPITEPTNQNKVDFENVFQNHFDRYARELGLFKDIDFLSPNFENTILFKKIGIIKDKSFFEPDQIITKRDFFRWYVFTIKPMIPNLSSAEFLELNEIDQNLEIDKILKKLNNKEKQFFNTLDGEFIRLNEVVSFLNLKENKKNSKKKVTRMSALNILINKLKESHKLKSLKKAYLHNYVYKNLSSFPSPTIKVGKHFIYVNDEKLKGIFVNWMEDFNVLSRTEIKRTISKMKEMQLKGVSIEIGWDAIEKEEGVLSFPKKFDFVLDALSKAGLYVHLLISPHYTPEWVFEKYDTDIRMVDIDGIPRDEGEYATYSFFSPAVKDQIRFQKKAVAHYSKFPNILTFLLGNEQSYGRTYDLDYSIWAKEEWNKFQEEIGILPTLIPKERSDQNFYLWKRFRQIGINRYFNKVYKETKKAQSRIPLSFKFIPYENTSSYAPDYGLHLSPIELNVDFLAVDIYGFTPNTYSLQYSFDIPKIVIETNMPGDWSEDEMSKYLLLNFIKGLPLQSVFAWVNGEFENALFHDDGSKWKKTDALKRVSTIIDLIDMPIKDNFDTAIIIPTHGINIHGKKYNEYQYKIDNIINDIFAETGQYPLLLWSDNLSYDSIYKWDKTFLNQFQNIIVIREESEGSKLNFDGLDLSKIDIRTEG